MSAPHPHLEIEAPPGEPMIIWRRLAEAPPALAFQAWTDPEHLRHWWCPPGMQFAACEIDLRVGGGYRFVQRAPDGRERVFQGTYLLIDPPHRLICTCIGDGAAGGEAVDSVNFDEADGGTLLSGRILHASIEARDRHVAAAMAEDMTGAHQRLDEWLASLRRAGKGPAAPLAVLEGTWEIVGRSAGMDHDDIHGQVTAKPILGGQVLELKGSMRVGETEVESLELVWPGMPAGGFDAHVYSGAGPPASYRWERRGDTLIHAGGGATYTGTISEDGTTIVGSWRPDPGQPPQPGSAYDATMRRVAAAPERRA